MQAASQGKAGLPATGKISSGVFERVVMRRLGAADDAVLVGPYPGVDIGIVSVAAGQVMAVTCDPVFVVPDFGWERASWFAVHILASDAATSGLAPRWMTVDLNLPPAAGDDDLAQLWEAFSAACEDLGIAVVGGHTARYEGCNWPMVGGATCMAVGPQDAYVTPRMGRPGDVIVVTKGPAIEATALFAMAFPERLAQALGAATVGAAAGLFDKMTVVPDCRLASAFGLSRNGVTSMHDATEGGVVGALFEVANASGTGLRADLSALPVPPAVRDVCDHVGIDPFRAISEGTLVATVVPERSEELVDAFAESGIPAAVVGELVEPGEGQRLTGADGAAAVGPGGPDPFWAAFASWAGSEGL